jgi:hypothetical protein
MVLLRSWTPNASQMSAPWLLLPFVLGSMQVRARRAMALGFVTTHAALVGYFALTLSPLEGEHLADVPAGVVAMLHGNLVYVVGGLVTGPPYGLLGQQWRVRRWWVSATLMAGALCLEPGARVVAGRLFPPSVVWAVEVGLGAQIAAYFAQRLQSHQRVQASGV